MIYALGNIWEDNSRVVVVPVNTIGAMGKGLAKEAAYRYPGVRVDYTIMCRRMELHPGGIRFWRNQHLPTAKTLILAATKENWRFDSKIEWVDEICSRLAKWMENESKDLIFPSISIPALGCGEGRLEWSVVMNTMHARLSGFGDNVRIYHPQVT